MTTGSSLTKGVRRTGGRNKSQSEWSSPDSNINFSNKKGNNQGDSDSDFTSFTSSMHGSTTSGTSSIDRYSSEMEGRSQRKKTLDKSNSKKRWSFRFSKRSQQSLSSGLPDDRSATTCNPSPIKVWDASPVQKPALKISRSGSLRSLKIVRNKSRSSTESKVPIAEDLHSNRATFSSILKDSKFPEQVEPLVGVKESDDNFPVGKLCRYPHCSLHGHHHHHEPPVNRFSFLKRRSSKDQKGVNPKPPTTVDKPSGKKTEVKATKKGSKVIKKNEKAIKEDVDFSIEFYAKTRTEHVLESSSGLDDADLANIMFGVDRNNPNDSQNSQMDDQDCSIVNIDKKNENSDGFVDVGAKKQGSVNGNQINMWRLIQRNMVSDFVSEFGSELGENLDKEKQSCTVDADDSSETRGFDSDDAVNQKNENRKIFVIKIVREAIEKILLPEVHDNQSITSEVISEQTEQNLVTNELCTEKGKPDGWSRIKKVMLLKRFINELEKVKKFDPKKHKLLPLVTESEAEKVSLRPQTVGDKKNSDDWMLDYALQQVVSELSPSQKRKVALIVKAFESVAPKLDDSKESNLIDENGDYKEFDEKGVDAFDQKSNLKKEKYMKMWHMVCQHVVADITTKVGSELLHDGDDEQEVKDENIKDEFSSRDADILIRQSVNEILLPKVHEDVNGGESQEQMIPKNWNKLKTLRRSIKDLESSRKPKPETQIQSVFQKEQEREQVDLRRQMSREKTKAEEWMIDYAVQHLVTKLTPARKKRVSMLVEAFEAVIPLPET